MNKSKLRLYPAAFSALTVTLALAACSNDEPGKDPLADGPVAARVTAGISPTTRVSVDETNKNKASFTGGDVIHVVTGNSTYNYTYDGSDWSPESSPYYFEDTDPVSFQAWYTDPDVKVENNKISIDTKTQEYDSESKWNAHDILVTPKVTTTVASPEISFTNRNAFRHIMSQITFTFKAGNGIKNLNGVSKYTLKTLTTDATFDALACTLTAGNMTGEIAVSLLCGAVKEYTCQPIILVPQDVTNGELTLEVVYNYENYTATLALPNSATALAEGTHYTFNVTVSNTGLKIDNAGIADWIQEDPSNGNATLK